jgi:hypothetical protein
MANQEKQVRNASEAVSRADVANGVEAEGQVMKEAAQDIDDYEAYFRSRIVGGEEVEVDSVGGKIEIPDYVVRKSFFGSDKSKELWGYVIEDKLPVKFKDTFGSSVKVMRAVNMELEIRLVLKESGYGKDKIKDAAGYAMLDYIFSNGRAAFRAYVNSYRDKNGKERRFNVFEIFNDIDSELLDINAKIADLS